MDFYGCCITGRGASTLSSVISTVSVLPSTLTSFSVLGQDKTWRQHDTATTMFTRRPLCVQGDLQASFAAHWSSWLQCCCAAWLLGQLVSYLKVFVCMVVCPACFYIARQWTGDLCRVSPASHPMTSRAGHWLPAPCKAGIADDGFNSSYFRFSPLLVRQCVKLTNDMQIKEVPYFFSFM